MSRSGSCWRPRQPISDARGTGAWGGAVPVVPLPAPRVGSPMRRRLGLCLVLLEEGGLSHLVPRVASGNGTSPLSSWSRTSLGGSFRPPGRWPCCGPGQVMHQGVPLGRPPLCTPTASLLARPRLWETRLSSGQEPRDSRAVGSDRTVVCPELPGLTLAPGPSHRSRSPLSATGTRCPRRGSGRPSPPASLCSPSPSSHSRR